MKIRPLLEKIVSKLVPDEDDNNADNEVKACEESRKSIVSI